MEPTPPSLAAIGWAIYGLGARAVSGIIFLIGPLILIDAARAAAETEESDDNSIGLLPTSLPSLTITIGLFAQCLAAPALAALADQYGMRRLLMALHITLGLGCIVALGLVSPSTPVYLQALLLATLYYAMALAWMFQNALLPSVATSAQRPNLSLASTALGNLGGAGFLILQYHMLRGEDVMHLPATSSLFPSAMDTVQSHPSGGTLHLVCLLAALWWFASAVPALACLSTLHEERLHAASVEGPSNSSQSSSSQRQAAAADGTVEEGEEEEEGVGVYSAGDDSTNQAAASTKRTEWDGAAAAPNSNAAADARHRGGRGRRIFTRSSLLSGLRRLRRHKHATRFVLSNTLYLTAATADGATAAAFAREVVGLDVVGIIRLTIFGAFAGVAGSLATMVLARCLGARSVMCVLMCLPPLILLYTSLVLESELELLLVGMLHAFVAGGVGFHGLNRGVFAQMIPRGREAEFFGVYFVSIKASSWLGPLLCTVLNEITGSLRVAVLSALAFYLPAIVILGCTDFEEARREAERAAHTPRSPLMKPVAADRHGTGAQERLLPGAALSAVSYGTMGGAPPARAQPPSV
jgi:MFS-type transporter involved in bile tolerance (Atg22 family)